MSAKRKIRVAIYTRKSTEEGLDQAFNSLHAQREACEAYVKSQAHEGWAVVPRNYDDGGHSGGTMERPALRALLEDIDRGHVHVVAVYKIDRLTRSLSDFAKIVERFEARSVSFVSITQSFNTATAMGRLTLHMLLSFAQFEREVTGERIRDKIAASKKKGMWMGGNPPTGYDVKDKKLMPNPEEAKAINYIFRRYLKLGSVSALCTDLRARGVRSKVRTLKDGRVRGGRPFTPGNLHILLRNRLYVGEVPYRGQAYSGEHRAIVPKALFEAVQARLEARKRRAATSTYASSALILTGLLYDSHGRLMGPAYAKKRDGRRYRYYASRLAPGVLDKRERVPAHAVEELMLDRLKRLADPLPIRRTDMVGTKARRRGGKSEAKFETLEATRTSLTRLVEAIEVTGRVVRIRLHRDELVQLLAARNQEPTSLDDESLAELTRRYLPPHDQVAATETEVVIEVSGTLARCGAETHILGPDGRPAVDAARIDQALLRVLVRAHYIVEMLMSAEAATLTEVAARLGCTEAYVRKILPLAFLSPRLTSLIIEGRQPAWITLDRLVEGDIPLSWEEQERRHLRAEDAAYEISRV